LLTAVGAGWVLKERVLSRQWFGLLLGLIGTILVLSGRLKDGFGLDGLIPALFALAGITIGTLYQKRFCPSFDWRTGAVAQFVPAAIATFIAAAFSEHFVLDPAPQLVFALAWLVLVLSLGAMSLLNNLIRSGSAINVVSLFYLVPACTAALAWALFGETLSIIALSGMALALWGVYLSRKQPPSAS
jgi:drug/metabolite transporter (DMT)-like permease